MKRNASVVWSGGHKDGKGRISTESGAIETGYGYSTRFGHEVGTNPEELLAASHASCFAMALVCQLEAAQMTAESITVKATVNLEEIDAEWTVTESHLDVTAMIPGADMAKFMTAANTAKVGCPISRLLGRTAKITMDAQLGQVVTS